MIIKIKREFVGYMDKMEVLGCENWILWHLQIRVEMFASLAKKQTSITQVSID